MQTKGSVFFYVGKVLELRSGLQLRYDLARMLFQTKRSCRSTRIVA